MKETLSSTKPLLVKVFYHSNGDTIRTLATQVFLFSFCFCWNKVLLCSSGWSRTHNPLVKTDLLQVIGLVPHGATDSLSHPTPLHAAALCHLRRLDELPECDRSLSRPTMMAFHVFPLSSLGVTPCRKYTARSSQLIPQTYNRWGAAERQLGTHLDLLSLLPGSRRAQQGCRTGMQRQAGVPYGDMGGMREC